MHSTSSDLKERDELRKRSRRRRALEAESSPRPWWRPLRFTHCVPALVPSLLRQGRHQSARLRGGAAGPASCSWPAPAPSRRPAMGEAGVSWHRVPW